MNVLTLLPERLASMSISPREIVLPLEAALEAINILESKRVKILGWEGWVRDEEGRIGHGNAPQGTVSLEAWPLKEAANFCRQTIKEDTAKWLLENPGTTDQLHFCITVCESSFQ